MTAIIRKKPYLSHHDIEQVVKCIVNQMTDALAAGERIEIRGFGSFALRERLPTMGCNEPVALPKRYSVRFKAGLKLSRRVCDSAHRYRISR